MRAIEHRGPVDEGLQSDEEYYFLSGEEMEERFGEEALQKTIDIAERCNLELTLGKFIFPEFPLPGK